VARVATTATAAARRRDGCASAAACNNGTWQHVGGHR
jgi:hypothetical protein